MSNRQISNFINKIRENKCLFLLLVIVIPLLIACFYANLSADDFSNFNVVNNQENILKVAIDGTVKFYMNWQGTYFSYFIHCLLSKICIIGGQRVLQWIMFFNVMLFVCALCFFWLAVLKRYLTILSNKTVKMVVFIMTTLSIMVLLYGNNPCENLYWLSGIVTYTLPLSMALIALGCIAIDNKTAIWGGIAAIMASGGSLSVSAFLCVFSLLLCFNYAVKYKKLPIGTIVFLVGTIMSMVNACAPGNFIRHGAFSEHYNISQTIFGAAINVLTLFGEFASNGTLAVLLILTIFFVNQETISEINYLNPILTIIFLFLGNIIICFPVNLGYSLAVGSSYPLRVAFVNRLAMFITCSILVFNIYGWINKQFQINEITLREKWILLLIMLISISGIVKPDSKYSFIPWKIYCDLADGDLVKYKETNAAIFSKLENADFQDDVVISVSDYDTLGYLKGIGLVADESNWCNVEVAQYYNINSVVFIKDEDD